MSEYANETPKQDEKPQDETPENTKQSTPPGDDDPPNGDEKKD